ncbi:hypothetical protein [Streptomyces sp. NPDC045470]|uniref:hypothetical protein n=1 Tax=Streptomyces sp. NPDC045470 TaxID=3155469 RepID=UPI00340A135B
MFLTAPVPAGATTAGSAPRYLVRPAEHADRSVVERLVAEHPSWVERRARPADPADNQVLRHLGVLDEGWRPMSWVLLEGSQVRCCALLVQNLTRDRTWLPDPQCGMSLWIDDLYADLKGPEADAYGPLLTSWFTDYAARYEQVDWVCAWTSDAELADDLGARHTMQVLRSAPHSASLLRRRPQRQPDLDRVVVAQLPQCVLSRRRS